MAEKYQIPLFNLNYDEAEEQAVIETLRSKWISTGPKNKEFEQMFAEMVGVKYAAALSNCTNALHLAMRILDITEGDEVICQSLTFVATVNAIRYVGATPVFCDIIDIDEPNIDPAKIEKAITHKTKAVIVMHYGGFACRMNEIQDICKKHKLKLIEDACHGPLSDYEGRKLGAIGDIGCFSFFSNKNISTGEGGMLVTNNEEYYRKANLLRSHGMTSLSYERSKGHTTQYDVLELGYNYRMDDIRAAIGLEQLKKLEDDITKRIGLRAYYLDKLRTVEEITIPFEFQFSFSSNYIFPIVLKNSNAKKRDKIRSQLAEKGIQTSIHYPPVHKFRIYNHKDYDLPLTEYYADNEITLPMYAELSVEEIDYIVESLENVLGQLKLSKPALI